MRASALNSVSNLSLTPFLPSSRISFLTLKSILLDDFYLRSNNIKYPKFNILYISEFKMQTLIPENYR